MSSRARREHDDRDHDSDRHRDPQPCPRIDPPEQHDFECRGGEERNHGDDMPEAFCLEGLGGTDADQRGKRGASSDT